ncbi:hypothetical protein Btru_001443 [Bulinus truncatus]|nr:hypothetical protein Btru_001443 [Bulinus truncatus]
MKLKSLCNPIFECTTLIHSKNTTGVTTIAIFLRYLTLTDLGALYTGVVYFIGRSVFGYELRKSSELSCKFHRWLSYVTCDLSSWALVLVSTARLISIVWPMKRLVTRLRVYLAIAATTVVFFLVNLPMFTMYGDVYAPGKKPKLCTLTLDAYEDFYNHVWGWLVLIKFTLLPGLILVGLNTALVVTVSRTLKAVNQMDEFGAGRPIASATSVKIAAVKWKKKGASSRENETQDSNVAEGSAIQMTSLENDQRSASINVLPETCDGEAVESPENWKECLQCKCSGGSDEVLLNEPPKRPAKTKCNGSENAKSGSSCVCKDTGFNKRGNENGDPFLLTPDIVSSTATYRARGHSNGHRDDSGPDARAAGDDRSDIKAVAADIDAGPRCPHHDVTLTTPHKRSKDWRSLFRFGKRKPGALVDDDVSVSSVSSEIGVTGYAHSEAATAARRSGGDDGGGGKAGKPRKRRGSSKKASAGRKSKSLTRSLVLINTVFLVCTIPISVYLATKVFLFTGTKYNATQDVFSSTANFIMYTNNSINFILYCVSGTRFRQQLQLMFKEFFAMVKRLAVKLMCPLKCRRLNDYRNIYFSILDSTSQ